MAMEKLNIYKNENVLESELKRLQRADLSKRDKEDIIRYQKYLLANGVEVPRVARLSMCLRTLSKLLNKEFRKARYLQRSSIFCI